MTVPPTKEPQYALSRLGPTVSVVLPNFNHARLIGRAVAALREQTRPPDEVVIIDDASTDGSLRVIEALAAGWSIVRVLANRENQGAIAALARGLGASAGKYVYFAAADDWIEPGFFASAVDALERHPQAGLFCGEAALVDGGTGRSLGIRPAVRPANRPVFIDGSATAELLRRSDNWILTGSAVFRRDRVLEAGGFRPELGSYADGYLARKIALWHGFCYHPEIVATWCLFQQGLSRAMATDAVLAAAFRTRALAHIAADPAFPSWYPALFDRRWRFATSRLAVIARPVNRAVLLRMSVASRLGRGLVGAVCRLPLGSPGRLMLLGWLWLRFRPMSLVGLSMTMWARYRERSRRPRSPDPCSRSFQAGNFSS